MSGRTLPMPPGLEADADADGDEKQEQPKRFLVVRYGNDALLETNLNRLYNEGYELRKVVYDAGLKRGAWGAVLENPSVLRSGRR